MTLWKAALAFFTYSDLLLARFFFFFKNKAKETYQDIIMWALELISDYRIRIGKLSIYVWTEIHISVTKK